jgi:hypothetical protein
LSYYLWSGQTLPPKFTSSTSCSSRLTHLFGGVCTRAATAASPRCTRCSRSHSMERLSPQSFRDSWEGVGMGCTTFRTDARKVLLSQFHFRVNELFLYEYDFGDLSQHQLRFEGVQPIREKKIYPVWWGLCITARRLRWAGSLHGEDGPSPLESTLG